MTEEATILDVPSSQLREGETYTFPCGCTFPIDASLPPVFGQHDSIIYNIEEIPLDCEATWDLIGSGRTKGIFQLESSLGKHWAKRLKPRTMEHLSALVALLRPGCISGDTRVTIRLTDRPDRKICQTKMKIRDLHQSFERNHIKFRGDLLSVDETTNRFVPNIIEQVVFSGNKEVYRPVFLTNGRNKSKTGHYNLECTLDHKLLTHDRGWIELQDLQSGERIATVNTRREKESKVSLAPGQKSFQSICWSNYAYCCVFCDWKEGSLDVNHIEGNRYTNNDPENLCFLCPNHHRTYSHGGITKQEVIAAREQYRLKNTDHIQWLEFSHKEYVGVKDTYDISAVAPNHNFIAGNIVVHNCLNAKDERGVSMTELYCRRKNQEEDEGEYIEEIRPILETTHNVMCYQEQMMKIAKELANFDLVQLDSLRKAAGKKDSALMVEMGKIFVDQAEAFGVVTKDTAEGIFENIKKSGRYLFNRAHSIAYAINSYRSAHWKCHFPLYFFTSFLYWAKDKQDPLKEIRQIINDAKHFGIEVEPPRFAELRPHFGPDANGVVVTFGLADVKGVGAKAVSKMLATSQELEKQIGPPISWSWFQFLTYGSCAFGATTVRRLIEVGALRDLTKEHRQRMLAEFDTWDRLSDKEKREVMNLGNPVLKEVQIKEKVEVEVPTYDKKAMKAYKGLMEQYEEECRLAEVEGKVTSVASEPPKHPEPIGTRLSKKLAVVGTQEVVVDQARPSDNLVDSLRGILARPGAVMASRRDKVQSLLSLLENPPAPLIDTVGWIAKKEEESLGVALTHSQTEAADKSIVNCTIKEYNDGYESGKQIIFAVQIQEVFERTVRNGDNRGRKMASLIIADDTGVLEDVVVFPDAWERHSHSLFRENTVVAIGGQRTWKEGENTFIVEEVWDI